MTGDAEDILGRIKALLPKRWFDGDTPILDALLAGPAWALALVYSLIQYAQLQTRIATATDGFLDLISFDYLGTALPRRQNEMDGAFRARILANLFREKGTRKGMVDTLTTLTGRTPIVFEPTRPSDTGAYNEGATLAYGLAGGYGSLRIPYWGFVKAFRPPGAGIPNVSGYGIPTGAYNTGSRLKYANLSEIAGSVTDADMYAAAAASKPEGTTIWMNISS